MLFMLLLVLNTLRMLQHKPIEFKVPGSPGADTSVEGRVGSEDRADMHRSARADPQPSRLAKSADSDAKRAERDPKVKHARDKSRTREAGASDAPEVKREEHDHRESRFARPEPKHAQHESKYDLDRAKRDAERARDQRHKEARHREGDREDRRKSPSRRQSIARCVTVELLVLVTEQCCTNNCTN